MWSGHNVRTINFCLVEDLPTLIWVANLASLELHTALHRAVGLEGHTRTRRGTPDMVVFDLDPGEPAAFAECAQVACGCGSRSTGSASPAFPKTSGSKGLQLYVPLNTPATYDETKSFARALAQVGERAHPKLVVSNMAKELRKGKVLIDWSQNDEHKTTVSVYSLRARPATHRVRPAPLAGGRGRRRRRAGAPDRGRRGRPPPRGRRRSVRPAPGIGTTPAVVWLTVQLEGGSSPASMG